MVNYTKLSRDDNGRLNPTHDKHKTVEYACRTCDYKRLKDRRQWKSDLTVAEINDSLKEITGDPSLMLMRKNGPNGETVVKVPMGPIEIVELHRYLSTTHAKYQMETCIACEAMGRQIASNEIPVSDDLEIF